MRKKFCDLATGFYRNADVGKNFHDFCFIYIETIAIAQSIHKENFCGSSKIHENRIAFLSRSYGMLILFYVHNFYE